MSHAKHAAAGIAALGRGDDKMLIHMTPGEVAGLQRLAMAHGGSLTINPKTGLPEAGFLRNILPMLVGAAASTVGGPMAGAAAGAATGALLNKDNRLQGAVMGGLGGYAGAGVAGALQGMGSSAALEGASQIGMQGGQAAGAEFNAEVMRQQANLAAQEAAMAQQIAPSGITDGFVNSPAYPAEEIVPKSISDAAAKQTLQAPPITESNYLAQLSPLERERLAAEAIDIGSNKGTMPDLSPTKNVYRGFQQLGQEGGLKQFGTELGKQYGGKMGMAAAGIGALGAVGAFDQPKMAFAPTATGSSTAKLSGPIRRAYDPNAPEGYYFTDRGILQPTYAAAGGVIENETDGIAEMASGGIASFKQGQYLDAFKRGRYLDGPGDGMSDSIPATIGSKQPARLADGEFVIPADVVSHIGNGSSKAGAKRLYAMMDRVRQARTGNKKQGKQINPNKFMPA